MTILITGANGLLGQKLVELLVNEPEVQVIATSRGHSRLKELPRPHEYQTLDITDNNLCRQIIGRFKPDVIINTAAITNVDYCELNRDECRMVNIEAVKHLIAEAEKNHSFFLQVSTDFVFSGTDGPYDEQDKPDPVNFYGQSKLYAEEIVMKSSIHSAIARTVLVYGVVADMSRSNMVLWVKESLEKGNAIQVVDDQWRTPTLAENLAKGCWLVIKNKAKGIYHLSGKNMMTPYQLALKTAKYFGLDQGLITRTDATKFTQPAKRPPKTGFIIDKAIQDLNYSPHSFEDGLAFVARQLGQFK